MKRALKVIIFFLFLISGLCSVVGMVYSNIINNLDKNFYLNGDDIVYIEYGKKYEEAGYNAIINNKNYIKNVTIESNINENVVGEYSIKYTLSYLKYTKELSRTVKVVDTVEPILELDCDDNQYIVLNSKIKDCTYKTNDNYDKDINNKVTIDSNVNTKKVGDYTITYTVTDSSNNKISKTINIHVRKKSDLNYIVISISKQRLDYYSNKKIIFTTPITSGRNNLTKTGTFKVKNKIRNTTLKGKDYESFVAYWLGYDGNMYGIHDASWRKRFGTKDYMINGSHGCINVPTKAMKQLFNMVDVGTPVYIKK